jgi:predicted nucleic acid-binding protein
VTRGLLDTSVVIAVARGEEVELPDEAAISVITLCGLHHGVLVANDRQRPGRLATLAMVERSFEPLPVDARVAPHYGRLISEARRGRRGRPRTADALIAATAISHGLRLYARDRDFERLAIPELVLT